MKAWRHIVKKRTVLVTACFVAIIFSAAVNFIIAPNAQALGANFTGPAGADSFGQISSKVDASVAGRLATGDQPGLISAFLNMVIGAIASAIIWLEGQIISLLTALVIFVVKYNDFAGSSAVRIGWTLVRDVANLFFVIVLLAIAIATILRVESYNFKKLLPKLILMAILVNFSKTIAGLILDFAQVVMLTFVAAFAGVAGDGNLVSALQVQSIINYKYDAVAASTVDLKTLVGTSMLMVIMLAITIVVLVVILVVLVMRVVMLWVLVVLSPLAYIMAAFPQGQRYAQQWWQEFSKYVIIGPVLGFFLWLTFAIASAGQLAQNDFPGMASEFGTAVIRGAAAQPSSPAAAVTKSNITITELNTEISRPEKMLSFVIAIAMLMGSLVITQQIGVAGGQFAGSMFNKIRSTGFKAAMLPIKGAAAGLGIAEKTLFGSTGIGLDPRRVFRGLGTRYAAWSGRMENQGGLKGAAMSQTLITSDSKFKRALGMGGLLMTSPADFAQNYLGVRGIIRGAKTLWSGTSNKELEDWNKQHDIEKEEIGKKRRFGDVQDIDEAGRLALVESTAEQNKKYLAAGSGMQVVEGDEAAGFNFAHKTTAALRAQMLSASKKELKELGLDERLEADDTGKKIKDTDDNFEVYQAAYVQHHAQRSVDHMGSYLDSSGANKKVDPAALRTAGTEYYDKRKAKLDEEITRVTAGGISNHQRDTRQNELELTNKQMLKVLKQIESQGGTGTAEQRVQLDELKAKGIALGGIARVDTVTGLDHFGKANGDRSVQDLVATGLKATTEEVKDLAKQDTMGRTYADNLSEQRRDLSYEATLAGMAPDDRRREQARFKLEADSDEKNLKQKDMELKQRAIASPIPYEALANMRKSEREELSKLPDEMEYTEIESELNTALQMKNTAKVRALVKKAAIDSNDNEFLKQYGYAQNSEGMRKFGDEILVGQLGMKNQEMYKFMDDVAYINEAHGHYDTSRMVTIDNGVARWATELEHAQSTSTENNKKSSRAFLQNTNRLGYGGYDPQLGHFKFGLSGKLTLAGFGDTEIRNRLQRGEFNSSALKNFSQDIDGLKDMVKKRMLSQATVDMIISQGRKLNEVDDQVINFDQYV